MQQGTTTRHRKLWGALICAILLAVSTLHAQAQDASQERLKAVEERMRALEAEVQSLRAALAAASLSTPTPAPIAAAPAVAPALTGPASGPPAQTPVYGGAGASAAKVLNPDIGIIGNFVGASGRNTNNPYPSLSMQESELSLQAILDPYARADFFLAIGEDGIEVEEGYVTFPALPGQFSLRVGRMRGAFGRVNTFHNHTLPWIDRPLAAFNLMGGSLKEADVGIKDAGLSLSRILPAIRGTFLEATAEVFRGDSGSLFSATRRSDISTIGRLRAYRDITESTNLELGGSYARGHNDVGSGFITQLYAADATFRWRPLRRSIYRSVAARSEFYWSHREQISDTQRAFGFFSSAEYQLGRRWFTGGRYDWSGRARNAAQHDSSGSLVLTFWPSEFSQIRTQLRQTHYAEGRVANELLFQFLFTLGAHGAHPF